MNVPVLLKKLTSHTANPCVTISLNTHRTHPDNTHDVVLLKNLVKEAEERVLAEFEKREVAALLENLSSITSQIDENYNLDSLHVFVSNNLFEIYRSPWPISNDGVHISTSFAVKPLIKALTRQEHYLIALLSQSGVKLFEAANDHIVSEVRNDDFPMAENPHVFYNAEMASDGKHRDNLLREYLNVVDKAIVKVNADTEQQVVVICTEDNFVKLLEVSDKGSMYLGYHTIDYNNTAPHQLAKQAWALIRDLQQVDQQKAAEEVKNAISQGMVITDLQDIYRAAIDGRADLLVVDQKFEQPVLMQDERAFDLIEDRTTLNAVDDIISTISWEVLSKNGRVVFTEKDELANLGQIALKTRY